MRHKAVLASAIAAFAFAGCSSLVPPGPPPVDYLAPASVTGNLTDAFGRSLGTATVTQIGDGIRLTVEGTGLPSGAHGLHFHQTGVCAAPDFASAGPHWNPANRQHGKDNPAGMHAGDLPNLLIGADGRGSLEYTLPGSRMAGGPNPLLDGDGFALILHSAADDYRTDPSGNSGARLACAAFR